MSHVVGRSRVHTDEMSAREWWTVILTALAGPVGSIGLGIGLARWVDATTGGMAALAGGVVGLWLGAPLAALIVFAVCLVTVARPLQVRRWIALLVMLAAVIAEAIVVLFGLRLTGGMATPEIGLVVIAIVAMGVLGGGATLALRSARRRDSPSAGGSSCAVEPAPPSASKGDPESPER